MNRVLIFGGNGKVARHLTTLLKTPPKEISVVSIIRSEDQAASLRDLGAEPVVQSIEDSTVSDLEKLIERTCPDAIVWMAGAGGGGSPERTLAVDRDGAVKVMDAHAGARFPPDLLTERRFILLSAVDVRDRNKPVPAWYGPEDRQRSDATWESIGTYMAAKLAADHELVTGNERRRLAYTIVRAGMLSDDPPGGTVAAGKVSIVSPISRADVAAVVLQCLFDRSSIGTVFDVVGPTEAHPGSPIYDEVNRVARARGGGDTFEGHH